MRFGKILLGTYQAVIAVFSSIVVFLAIYSFFGPSLNVSYNWPYIILLFLLLVPAIIFCSCNAVKLFLPARNIFGKWKHLTTASIIFTVLWTLLIAHLYIYQTNSGSCQTSVVVSRPNAIPQDNSPQIRQIAPDFSVTDQFGRIVSLSKLRGKTVLLDFWGVWCGPCRRKLPDTQKIYDRFKNRGLAVIGIHSAFRTEKTADFIAENNYTFPTGIDTGNTAKSYKVKAWPTYYLIDKQGRFAWGPKHAPPSEKLIKSLLED